MTASAQVLHPMLRGLPPTRRKLYEAGLRSGAVDPLAAPKAARLQAEADARAAAQAADEEERRQAERRRAEERARLDAALVEAARQQAEATPWRRILREVCEAHNVPAADLVGPTRVAKVIIARHELCYRMIAETGMSFPEAGRRINRDHSTVIHGARQHAYRNGLPEVHGRARPGRAG